MEKYGNLVIFLIRLCIKCMFMEKYVSKYCIQSSKNNKKAGKNFPA